VGYITGGKIIEGSMGVYPWVGVPSAGTTAVQTLTYGGTITAGATSGIYLTFEGATTGLILWSATDATLVANIDAALEALPTIGTGGVTTAAGTVSSGIGTVTVTFAGNLAKKAVGVMTVTNALTGTSPTITVTNTTPGVDASLRGLPTGALVTNVTSGLLYENTGTPTAPTFTAQA
jgi:hypothetical protein